MKWFDTKEIKAEETLTPEQISYLRKPSITILGPFNVIVRNHWDLFVTGLVLSIAILVVQWLVLGVDYTDTDAGFLASIPEYLLDVLLIWFGIKHGRRLAWNRNGWKSFEDFEKSERRWTPWGWLVLVIIIGEFLYTLVTSL